MNVQRVVGILMLLCVVAGSLVAQDQKRGPSTPEEREMAVKFTRFLERSPLHEEAKNAREWLLFFFIRIPDITVKMCSEFLPRWGDEDEKKDILNVLPGQMMFSQGAFIIENPKKSKKDRVIYLAGLEGALRSYESMVRDNPETQRKALDELIAMRDTGELDAYVKKKMKGCR